MAELGEMNGKLLLILGSKLAQSHKVEQEFESLGLQPIASMFWFPYESQNATFQQYPGSYQCYSWSWETGSQSFFLWSFWHWCCQINIQNWKQQNNIFKGHIASLGFFKSSTVWGLQKPPHTSIFHESFYESSYEAIKMIYSCFLIASILNSSV